ncbi:hypothetical protein DSO57_1005004 [Entomophthora muscae]|uniref:Uncharacterized protein n=1 Tax=Entomophthora muscae TaxID=34485 RepID=A0ACC2SXE0_9FUNG|nr:hypothetical protein DSO57_1005004 [Entomophthora muscae]
MAFEDIPWHILEEVFQQLKAVEVQRCRVMCRFWNSVICREPFVSLCVGVSGEDRHGFQQYGANVARVIVCDAAPAKMKMIAKYCKRVLELEMVGVDANMSYEDESRLANCVDEMHARYITVFSQDILNDDVVLSMGNLTCLSSSCKYSHREMVTFLKNTAIPNIKSLELEFEAADNSIYMLMSETFMFLKRVTFTCLFRSPEVKYLLFPPIHTLREVDVSLKFSNVRNYYYPDIETANIHKAHFKSEAHVCFFPSGSPVFEKTKAVSLDLEISLHEQFHVVFPSAFSLALTSTPQSTIPRTVYELKTLKALTLVVFESGWEDIGWQPSITHLKIDDSGDQGPVLLRWLTAALPSLYQLKINHLQVDIWTHEINQLQLAFPSLIVFETTSRLTRSFYWALANASQQLRLIRSPRHAHSMQAFHTNFPQIDMEYL